MRKPNLVVIAAAAGVLALAGCSSGIAAANTAPSVPGNVSAAVGQVGTISAQGVGQASGVPDTVTISIGVETKAATAKAAMDEKATKAAALIAVLKSNGVADKDLQTSQLSVYPAQDQNGKITGYQVNNQVTAKIKGVDKAGAMIDAAGNAAGDAIRVQGLSFSFGDDTAVMAAARADAVKQAQGQAKQLADAAGVKLGAIRAIVEEPSGNNYPTMYASRDSAAGSPAPIEPGSMKLSVSVQVVYEIAP